MRWDFGQVYQKIRKSKGISQSQAAGNFCSRGHLSNIEKNKDVPSYELMEHLLRQIDMTFGEFDYICNYYKPSKRKNILVRISKYSSAVDTDELKEIAQLCEEYLQEMEDLPIQNVLNLVRVFIEIRTNGPSEKAYQLADIIWQDLKRRDTWYESDLRMLGAILYSFDFETIQETTGKILDSLARYRDYIDLQKVHFSILSN
ncbi:helix-turn-helix domain-containing protein [Streptococcus massiliensis]|uniref:Transcriptional regulator n=1 Tax=Streptococcus massiliensis TaxID=313439 RepID=A0A380KWN5_9STRE|nr:helix-turn-helix transcriptional regulator [Streptococcus massiliensis]SUN76343.1 transcriptional regulator [Streptococcus massiliensis]